MKWMIAALIGAQLSVAQTAQAAELTGDNSRGASQSAAFAGARLRVPLGGGREKARAGLALTSTLRSGASGELRFAKGAELGFAAGEDRIDLAFGGVPMSHFGQGRGGPQGRKLGVSTIGWVAISVAVVAVVVVGAAYACVSDDDCISDDE